MMQTVKSPNVAGLFYPADPNILQQDIHGYIHAATYDFPSPKALIAPHAGYMYSGPIAGYAYASLLNNPDFENIDIVLLGPAHFYPVTGVALPTVNYFETPLGKVPLNTDLLQNFSALENVAFEDAAFEREHSLEVHIPFLQTCLSQFTLTPLLVGQCDPTQLSQHLATVFDRPHTLIIVSSDLSHYHPYKEAQTIDQQTSSAIESFNLDFLNAHRACGYLPIQALLHLSQSRHLTCKNLSLKNSGDTAGSKDKVVGYGAYCVY